MNFDLTDDQQALRQGVRELCSGRFSIERVQQLEHSDGFDVDGWQALREAGVFDLRLAESAGGVGLGMAEAALVFAELGRALAPGPLIATHLGAAFVDGTAVGMVTPRPGPILLAFPDVVDRVVVVEDRRLRAVDRAELSVRPVERPLDPLTPLAVVDDLAAGEVVGGPDEVLRVRREGAVLAAALLLGICEWLTERSTGYAKEREQFGRPIGSFQAIKHMLADMVVRTEVTRAAVHAAAVTLDDPVVGDVQRAVSAAKLLAGKSALANGKAAVQIHGGMGFTWEVPVHLYLKRAAWHDLAFGTVEDHAEAMAGFL